MLLSSSVVHALGVGEIEVETALNEPLTAKIKLLSASAEELKTLSVNLAPREAFSRMGIERHPLLRELEFELVTDSGSPYIAVTSRKSVREPFLDFILTLNWANGQMLREYTLLLDPPVFDTSEQAGKISAASTTPAEIVREPAQQSQVATGSYGPTTGADTLWSIGQQMRPSRDISVPQMMIALLKKNPDAFGGGNINNLKAGYILRQPEMNIIKELSRPQAAREANRQYQAWLADTGRAKPTRAARTQQRVTETTPVVAKELPSEVPVAEKAAVSEARLQLLTADEEARVRSGVGSGAAGEEGLGDGRLKQELAFAIEASETMRQENNELRSRLEALEAQLQSVQKLLTLKSDTLGNLQAGQVAAPVNNTPVAEDVKAQTPPAVPAPAAAPASAPVAESSLVDEILTDPNFPMIAGGGLVALLLGGLLIARRRRQSDDDEVIPSVVAVPAAAAGTAAATSSTDTTNDGLADAIEDDVSLGDFGGGMGAIHAEESEIDPIAEADVYLAYRRYEQAEALMKEAIASDPERPELKLKLLEIYYTTKDTDSFEAQAEALYAGLAGQNEELWQQAVEMGREIMPEHPLFSDGATAGSPDADLMDELDSENELVDSLSPADDGPNITEAETVLSDDDLANSLMGDDFSLDAELSDVSEPALDDLNLDDLDLDLGTDLDMSDTDAVDSLDDFNLGDEGLESIASDESLADALDLGLDTDKPRDTGKDKGLNEEPLVDALAEADSADLNLGELEEIAEQDEFGSALDEAFNLESLPESLDDLAAELDGSLDEFELPESTDDADLLADVGDLEGLDIDALADAERLDDKNKKADGEAGLSLVDHDSSHQEDDNEFANPDLDAFSSEESEAWDIEPAQSVFEARDVSADVSDNDLLVRPDVKAVKLEAVADATPVAPESEEDSLVDIADLGDMDFSEMADDEDSDIFDSSDDMVGTKLDLAKAYIEMGDQEGAGSILDEVAKEGNDSQRLEAEGLKQQIS